MASKLTSRKFWVTVLSSIAGVAASLCATDGKIGQICIIISILVPPIVYVITEGTIDAKAVGQFADAVKEITEIVSEEKKECDENADSDTVDA